MWGINTPSRMTNAWQINNSVKDVAALRVCRFFRQVADVVFLVYRNFAFPKFMIQETLCFLVPCTN